ncbi:Maf family protein [Thermosulfuriphilus sp.]
MDHSEYPGPFRNLAPLILASASPRRRELLARLGLSFEVWPARVSEEKRPLESPQDYVCRLSLAKAQAVAQIWPKAFVLAADTAVTIRGDILGKPQDREDARRMLQLLSGKEHRVFTGYTILGPRGQKRQGVIGTSVVFKDLSPREIEAYLQTQEPWDKAGAYAIQGMAAYMIRLVQGSVSNVIGLPLTEVIEDLLALGVISIKQS